MVRYRRSVLVVALAGGSWATWACSGGDAPATPGGADASVEASIDAGSGSPGDGGSPVTSDAAVDGGTDAVADAPAPVDVVFAYQAQWTGAKSVEVLGAFGAATDWKKPLVTLAAAPDADGGASGAFSGTAHLPPGEYTYVFRVVGDDAASAPTTFSRYALDPAADHVAPCPAASPTYAKTNDNACSVLTVGATRPALVHVRGTVVAGGAARAGFLVRIDRDETTAHHFFVNRTTSAADGTYDLDVVPGRYFVQVLHPDFLRETDATLDPLTAGTVRRTLSETIAVKADVTLASAEVSYGDYASLAPRDAGAPDGAAALPTTFAYTVLGGATSARLDVYGAGDAGEVGDPWYAGPESDAGTAVFDGGFNTKQATETSVHLGERYFWGTEQIDATDGGVRWTRQSMVFPVRWD